MKFKSNEMNYGFIFKDLQLPTMDVMVIQQRIKARIELERQEVLNPFEHDADNDIWYMHNNAAKAYPNFPNGHFKYLSQAEIALGLYKATPTKSWDYQELYKLSKFVTNGLLSL